MRCGLAAGPVFVAVFGAEGAVREDYSPLRHPVSSLALGPRGWIQAANFAVTGTLVLAGAAGLYRAAGPVTGRAVPVLIGAAGTGLLGSAAFTTDPVGGYPPGIPDAVPGHPSRTGTIHTLCGIPVLAGLPAAALTYAWRSRGTGQRAFGRYSTGTAITMLAATVLASAGLGQSPRLAGLGGLLQRTSIIAGFTWLTALSAQTLCSPAHPAPSRR